MGIKFFVIFSILLIFPILANAQEECILDKYIEVSGDFVKVNCATKDITSKEKTNILIITKDNGISISPLFIDGKYLPMDFKEISKDPIIYKLNQSQDIGHYAFQLTVQGEGFWLFNIFYINSREWNLKYGNKTSPTIEKCGDKICNLDENCQNCTIDCGKCPFPTPPKITRPQKDEQESTSKLKAWIKIKLIEFGIELETKNVTLIFLVVLVICIGFYYFFIRGKVKNRKPKP